MDQAGVAFDAGKHELDKVTGTGRLSKSGRWMLKRGNGSRIAAGKPPAGAIKSNLILPPDHQAAAPPAPTAPGQPEGPASAGTAPGTAPLHKGPVTVTVGLPPPPAPTALEDYESTAVGMANGVWACAQLMGGPKWEPTPDEVGAWSKALQRVWHHYQLPIVGPLVELVILGFRSAAKRADSSRVRGFFSAAWSWARGGRFQAPEATPADKVS